MGNDICCQFFESVRMTENCRHATHGPFAFLDLLRIGAFGSTLLIVLLDFFGLFIRYDNTGQSRLVSDTYGYSIIAGFFHRVAVNNTTENCDSFVNRRSGKTAVRRIWKTITQVFGKTVR